MKVGTRRLRQGLVGGVADQQVSEAVPVVARQLRLFRTQQILADEGRQASVEARLVRAEGGDGAAVEDLALDRPAFENVSLGRVELVEPRGKERLDRRRNGNRASVVGLLDERQHLLDEERVATRRSADTQVQRLLQRGAL